MDFVRLTEEEKNVVLSSLDSKEKDSIPFAESILQKDLYQQGRLSPRNGRFL